MHAHRQDLAGSRRRSWEPVLFALLVATILLAPLPLGANRPLSSSALFTVVGALVALWGLGVVLGRVRYTVPLRAIWWIGLPFALVAVWAAVQAVPWTPAELHHPYWDRARDLLEVPVAGAISVNPHKTWTNLLWLLGYGGIFWLALQLARPPERASAAIAALAVAGLAYATYGLLVHLSGGETILWYDGWAGHGSVSGTFVNRNHFATYAGLTLLCALGLLTQSLRRRLPAEAPWRAQMVAIVEQANLPLLLGGLGTLVIATALLLSRSRGGVLATLLAVVVLLAALGAHRWPGRWVYGGIVVTVVAVLAGLVEFSGASVARRVSETDVGHEQRLMIFGATLEAIADRPWLGSGYGTYEEAFRPYDREVIRNLVTDKAHNTYLQNALELGVPAAAMLVLGVALAALRCLAGLRRRRRQQATLAVALAASVLVAAHALVDFSLELPAIAATYALLLGVGCAQSWSSGVQAGALPTGSAALPGPTGRDLPGEERA